MNKYDYKGVVEESILDWLEDENNQKKYADMYGSYDLNVIFPHIYNNDDVTGNGSGSYTHNKAEAEKNLCYNFDLLKEAIDEFVIDDEYWEAMRSAETADVAIRCYMVKTILGKVLEEWNEEHGEPHGDSGSDWDY